MKLSSPKIQSYTFRVVIEPDAFADGTPAYHASIPALQGCDTWGYTVEEALRNVEEAARMLLEIMRERGEPIPQDRDHVEIKEEPRVTVNLPHG